MLLFSIKKIETEKEKTGRGLSANVTSSLLSTVASLPLAAVSTIAASRPCRHQAPHDALLLPPFPLLLTCSSLTFPLLSLRFSRAGNPSSFLPPPLPSCPPATPATRSQDDAATSSSSSSSTSPPQQSTREALVRRHRPVPLRHCRRRPSTIAVVPEVPTPLRPALRAPGELAVRPDTSFFLLPLCPEPSPCTAAAAAPWSPPAMLRRPYGPSLRSPCSSTSPLASIASPRVQFRAETTNS